MQKSEWETLLGEGCMVKVPNSCDNKAISTQLSWIGLAWAWAELGKTDPDQWTKWPIMDFETFSGEWTEWPYDSRDPLKNIGPTLN